MSGNTQVAGLFPRLAAWVIDMSVPVTLGLLAVVVSETIDNRAAVTSLLVATALASLVWGLYLWWGYATRGAGLGFQVMRLRLAGAGDGQPIGWGRYLLRQAIWALLATTVVPLLIMLLLLVLNPRHRGWHDLASGAVAVEAPTADGSSPRPSSLFGEQREGDDWQQQEHPELTDTRRSSRRRNLPAIEFPIVESTPTSPTTRRQAARWEGEDQEQVTRIRPRPSNGAERTPTPRPGGRSGSEGWFFVLDDGRQFDIKGLVVLGRKPAQPTGRTDALLVTAGEGDYAVSKNHLTLGVDERGVWVQDNNSTNGTAVVNRAGEFESCPPGTQVRLREGQLVAFGDRGLTLRRTPLTLGGA